MKIVPTGRRCHWIVIGIIAVISVLLRSDGFYTLIPDATYDDALQFSLAQNITDGEWLGKYNALTLAKGVTYPVWLATMHASDIPLWLAQVLFYTLACIALMYAIRGIFRNKWILPIIFSVLVFNPMLSDRVYRDAISPSLLLLVLAWTVGIVLLVFNQNHSGTKRKQDFIINTAFGGVALPAWWFLREDSFWIAPYLALFFITVITAILISHKNKRHKTFLVFSSKITQLTLLLLPLVTTVLSGVTIAFINSQKYDRFVVNDYTSSEFEAAYGALTRIHDHNWQPTVPVSSSMRHQAYEASPLFAELKPCLDSDGKGACEVFRHTNIQIRNEDYEGGWFFWALRLAVEREGYYESPSKARQYYINLADQINSACETGRLQCDYGKRSSLASPFRKEVVPLTAKKFASASSYFLTFKDSLTLHDRVAESFNPGKQQMADYYNIRYNSGELNFTANLKHKLQRMGARTYELLSLVLFVFSMVALVVMTVRLFGRRANKLHRSTQLAAITICWVLLGTLVMLRLVMLAYVSATSFPAINVLYLSSLYVVVLTMYCIIIGMVLDCLYDHLKG